MQVFRTRLRGETEVPPVTTIATGNASITVSNDQAIMLVRVAVENLRNIMVAHIHLGMPGVSGPIVAFLLRASMPFSVGPETRIVDRALTAADLIGPLQGQSLAVLADAMRSGNAYVNVHTIAHPDGEIRGQLVRVL